MKKTLLITSLLVALSGSASVMAGTCEIGTDTLRCDSLSMNSGMKGTQGLNYGHLEDVTAMTKDGQKVTISLSYRFRRGNHSAGGSRVAEEIEKQLRDEISLVTDAELLSNGQEVIKTAIWNAGDVFTVKRVRTFVAFDKVSKIVINRI